MLPSIAAITPQYVEATLRGGLAGNHVQAWELFDLMIDTSPEVASCIGEYVDGVRGKKMLVEPYADEGEEPTPVAQEKAKLMSFALRNMRPDMANDENDFSATVKDILFARFHGQSVLEIDWYKQDGSGLNVKTCATLRGGANNGQVVVPRSTFWVHPVCYAWNMDGRLGLRMALESEMQKAISKANNLKFMPNILGNFGADRMRSMVEPPVWNTIASQARPSQLMDFPANKFLIGIDKFKSGTVMGSGSVLRTLAFWWICSTMAADFALNYAQLFGIPFRKATCAPSTSEAKKSEIRQMLASAGSMGYILLDSGNDVTFESAAGGASESPQAFLLHFANDQIRKVILRQTMSGGTAGGGSKGVGKSFGDVEAEGPKDQCLNSGAAFASSVVNLQLVPYILNVNYGPDGDSEAPTVTLVDEKRGTLGDAQILNLLAPSMPIGAKKVRMMFEYPKPSEGEEVLTPPQKAAGFGGGAGGGFGGGGEGQPQDGSGAAEARAALDAGAAAVATSKALAETVSPLVERFRAVDAIGDPDVRRTALEKLLKDIPKIAAALKRDPSLAESLAKSVGGAA